MALLDLSSNTISGLYVGLVLLLAGGIVAGFVGDWWGQGWIWVALGTLVALMIFMYVVATPYYKRLRTIVGAMVEGSEAIGQDRLARLLAGPRAVVLAVVGIVGLLFIVYLMFFKPF
jgi:hypothetical protein